MLSEKTKIEPILYLPTLRKEKIKVNCYFSFLNTDIACLSKYFPKYCNKLDLGRYYPKRAVQSRVKLLKIVRHCDCERYSMSSDKKMLKRLFQNNRKTLKSLPVISIPDGGGSFQYFSSCPYFSRIETLNLGKRQFCYDHIKPMSKIFRSYGHLWSSQFVENLKVNDSDLMIIKKLDGSERFLSSLKTLELQISANLGIQRSRDLLMELKKNKEFLRYVTCLKIGEVEGRDEKSFEWEVIQELIDCCPQMRCLLFSTGHRGMEEESHEGLSQEFCIDLSCLQNLQVLEIEITDLKAFINGIEFPSSLQEILFKIDGAEEPGGLMELFNENNNMIENQEEQDLRDWESFEKHKVLYHFLKKWKNLNNLKAFSLYLWTIFDVDLLVNNFVLPLLKAISQLETFGWELRSPEGHNTLFDLEAFLYGIRSLQPLKNIKIYTDKNYDCIFSGLSGKFLDLSNLSSIKVDIGMSSSFDLNLFLQIDDNPERKNSLVKGDLKFSGLCLFGVEEFARLLNLMHSVSYFKNLQVHLWIDLIVENIDEIYLNFKYPIDVASNTLLTVDIYLKEFETRELTAEKKEYFEMIFGKLQFSVKEANKFKCEPYSQKMHGLHKVLMKI